MFFLEKKNASQNKIERGAVRQTTGRSSRGLLSRGPSGQTPRPARCRSVGSTRRVCACRDCVCRNSQSSGTAAPSPGANNFNLFGTQIIKQM